MDNKNMDRALDIVSKLMNGEEIHRSKGNNIVLYEEYMGNIEVYDFVRTIMKKLNLSLYEYNDGLYMTAGENNRVFGYSNEELKKEIGVKLNKELYLCYFIIYQILTKFYKDSATATYLEFIKAEEIIHSVDYSLAHVISKLDILVQSEMEENSFRTIAVLWEDLPAVSGEETGNLRAARNSKAGYVKMVFNFLVSQGLLLEDQERYYPKERLSALTENYFEEYKGRLYEIMDEKRGKENAPY